MLWGRCIYSDQHAFVAILSIDKELFFNQPPEFNLEDMNAQIRHWFGTLGWFVQLLGGTFRQESDNPTFFIIWQSLTINHVIVKNLGYT